MSLVGVRRTTKNLALGREKEILHSLRSLRMTNAIAVDCVFLGVNSPFWDSHGSRQHPKNAPSFVKHSFQPLPIAAEFV
jgi:hypothetical protein